MLGQKIDKKSSWWLFACLIGGMILAPMIVGGATKDGSMKTIVVACVLFASGIVGALAKERSLALCSAILLTWPAFGYALLMTVLGGLNPAGSSAPGASLLAFAGVLMIAAPAVTYVTGRFAAPPARVA